MQYQHEGATLVLTCTPSLAPSQGDLNEFNQCQTQLLALYKKGIKGSVMEFRAYTLLYLLHQNQASELAAILKTLTDVCPALATMHAPSPAPRDTSHTQLVLPCSGGSATPIRGSCTRSPRSCGCGQLSQVLQAVR